MLPPSMRTLRATISYIPLGDETAAAEVCLDRVRVQWVSGDFLQIPNRCGFAATTYVRRHWLKCLDKRRPWPPWIGSQYSSGSGAPRMSIPTIPLCRLARRGMALEIDRQGEPVPDIDRPTEKRPVGMRAFELRAGVFIGREIGSRAAWRVKRATTNSGSAAP